MIEGPVQGASVTLKRGGQEFTGLPIYVYEDAMFVATRLGENYIVLKSNGMTAHGGFNWTDLVLPLEYRRNTDGGPLTVVSVVELAKRRMGL